jgi:hypothetical protein
LHITKSCVTLCFFFSLVYRTARRLDFLRKISLR